ncbi:MAG: hypothetical protein WKF51_02475, partial [Geodermatophilaceae bacterium]
MTNTAMAATVVITAPATATARAPRVRSLGPGNIPSPAARAGITTTAMAATVAKLIIGQPRSLRSPVGHRGSANVSRSSIEEVAR